ncbi:hypothetical protein SEA_SIXAMA_5 [Gordonia phage Sixama]|uniref:Uncharacterized protein n=1 Tax=Gordonia phage Sixama TaxID=2653271 RepID=A0A5Q2F526_9CAUD|nr:hypothetical protein PP302_gp005 [Gordonia phage Sixama]QGF20184.1 hypothetical protein SEA_SIXAMA_5 [Gordonia phage Sixama]
MKRFDLWVEGYAATGQSGGAQSLGMWEGATFADAVLAWDRAENATGNWGQLVLPAGKKGESGDWRLWGCRVFDNREDAQRAFG